MTTSSNHPTHPAPEPNRNHWDELIATLPTEKTEQFGEWLRHELDVMECDNADFITPESLKKSLRR